VRCPAACLVHRLELRDVATALLDQVGELEQQVLPIAPAASRPRPAVERTSRGLDGAIDVGCVRRPGPRVICSAVAGVEDRKVRPDAASTNSPSISIRLFDVLLDVPQRAFRQHIFIGSIYKGRIRPGAHPAIG
jgi:hypothetical protein